MARANSDRIRKPGEAFELTDEELLAAPVRMLSPEQRRKRRRLRNNISKDKTRANRKARRNGDLGSITKIKTCQGIRKNGEKCEAYALTYAKHCTAHLTQEERERLGVIEPDRSSGGRPKQKINANQLMREVVEKAMHKVVKPHLDALGAEFVGFDEDGNVVVRDLGPDAGLMLYGESKDGDINMTNFPDIGGRIQAAEKLLDRTYGKPRQTQVIEGGVNPVQVQPVRSVDRAREVIGLVSQLGMVAPPTLPAGPEEIEALSESASGPVEAEVIELRKDQD